MKNWIATTQGGTTYQMQDGIVTITPSNEQPPYAIKPWLMQVNAVPVTACDLPWKNPEDWEDVLYPVVGRHFFIAGRDDRRISTTIVSVVDTD